MTENPHTPCYVTFDEERCTECAACVRTCPTNAIRIRNGRAVQVDQCIGCGECIRICPVGAVSASTSTLQTLNTDHILVALVPPSLYAQFPGALPEEVLEGLRQMGFHHAVDMSYFLEMFQGAAEEYIRRNRETHQSPWPLISPICPIVVRLVAWKFPSLLPNLLPVIRPVSLMAREISKRIVKEYQIDRERISFYYINPCPTKMGPDRSLLRPDRPYVDQALGINEIYGELSRKIERIRKTGQIKTIVDPFHYRTTGGSLIWGMSGGEITGMSVEHSLAVSGLKETILYLEKIEMGLFQDVEYIEFRTCLEGCLGGTLTAIDKYLAKSAVQKMVLKYGIERRVPQDEIVRLYNEGFFASKTTHARLTQLFGMQKEPLSIEQLKQIHRIVEQIHGKNCAACGAPDCRTFAEDVIRGRASLDECLVLQARQASENGKDCP